MHDAVARRMDRVLHLHRLDHRQRLAARDAVAGLGQVGDQLAGHRRRQLAAGRCALAGVGDVVDLAHVAAALGREHGDLFAVGVDAQGQPALAERHVVVVAARRAHPQRPARLADLELQRTVVQPRQRHRVLGVAAQQVKVPARTAVQPKAVAPRPRIGVLQRRLVGERVRRHAGGHDFERQRRLFEQRRALALDQRGVEIGLGERA